MTTEFYRFPHTPHLAWLGAGSPRGDKLLDPVEIDELLAGPVSVEEKLDGANLGIARDESGQLRPQNRGTWLEPPYRGQFSRLNEWLMSRLAVFQASLPEHLILFGEWCAARHSLAYDNLPDWFLLFDVFDRNTQRFWSRKRRNTLAGNLNLATVPLLREGRFTRRGLEHLLLDAVSAYRAGPPEGIVIRQDIGRWNKRRAKLVHPDFVQGIEEHWRSRPIEWNTLKPAAVSYHSKAH